MKGTALRPMKRLAPGNFCINVTHVIDQSPVGCQPVGSYSWDNLFEPMVLGWILQWPQAWFLYLMASDILA